MIKRLTKSLCAVMFATACLSSVVPAMADTELVFSSWLPPRHPIVVNAMKPWARDIAKVTDGRVTVRVLSKPLGPPPAHFDMAVEGIVDITYGLHSFTKDERFQRSRIGQFSFIGDDAIGASNAFWNIYSGQLDAQAEHQGVKLLGLFVHGPGLLHSKARKVDDLSDLSGLKILTPGGYIANLMNELGATTLFMSSSEVYEKLSRGVVDGVTFTYEALTAFKLTNNITYSMRVPGGIYNTTWFVVINDEKWSKISPEDQKAIEAISGEALATRVGKAWNDADQKAIGKINKAGIKIYDAPSDVLNAITTIAAKEEREWIKAVEKEGYDGTAALQLIRETSGVER